jgi:para-nitrobenzyl esterase
MSILVQTTGGQVQGQQQGAITVWKGIPFATPPTGKRRFLPPLPAQPWSGTLDATQFGAVSIQSNSAFGGTITELNMSEDCLTLNIWSPGADQKRRPVMVYIHGGAFVTGSSSESLYDGTSFAEKHDIVVVTCNYRLGLLGLLYLGDLAGEEYAQGNCALLDQIAALQWVRDNIAAFGGDPNQVTIMGESAGAMSVGTLLSMPAAKGLFQRAILESGASTSGLIPRERATRTTQAVLGKLNLDASQVLALSEIPVETLVNVQTEIARERGGLAAFAPVIDGVTLPKYPLEVIDEGLGSQVPLLLGTNRDEWNLFTVLLGMSVDQVKAGMQRMFGEKAEEIHRVYVQAREDTSDDLAWVDMQGDRSFRIPAIRQAESQLPYAQVWMYRFDWSSPAMEGKLGSCHALEMPFVWNSQSLFSQFLLGEAIVSAQPLIDRIHTTWASFIRTGNPNSPALPDWPTYTLARRSTMILNETSQVLEQPQAELLPLWTGIA